jgi:hypothetical protein
VESPDNFFEITKGIRESPLVESLGNHCKIRTLEQRLTEKCRLLRRIDLVFPDNDAKMLSHSLYLEVKER